MLHQWSQNSVFYQIFPLGFSGCPPQNDMYSEPQPRLERIYDWLDHIQSLGITALYLGPVFESSTHGYDTIDYYQVDRRLGNFDDLKRLSEEIHRRGLRLVLDAVFNHVGRDFWAFRDLKNNLENSIYQDWFHNLTFGETNPIGDPFSYEGWKGHYDLVKLNLCNDAVVEHLLGAVELWIREFDIDGLRLDAADCMDFDFFNKLRTFCQERKPDFWLMGEVVHGDYSQWAAPGLLDSVTNYECYKGLYSSHNDQNYFEIAYSLNRQFGKEGIYQDIPLYNFVDNHDVDRIATRLKNFAHIYPLHCLLFTMPGIPSIYYGSEFCIMGKGGGNGDWALRPSLDINQLLLTSNGNNLSEEISRLSALRRNSSALRLGNYEELLVQPLLLIFSREFMSEKVVVIVNAQSDPVSVAIDLPGGYEKATDILNHNQTYPIVGGKLELNTVPATWAQVLSLS